MNDQSSSGEPSGEENSIDRRRMLKMAGATVPLGITGVAESEESPSMNRRIISTSLGYKPHRVFPGGHYCSITPIRVRPDRFISLSSGLSDDVVGVFENNETVVVTERPNGTYEFHGYDEASGGLQLFTDINTEFKVVENDIRRLQEEPIPPVRLSVKYDRAELIPESAGVQSIEATERDSSPGKLEFSSVPVESGGGPSTLRIQEVTPSIYLNDLGRRWVSNR
jgi:hypothetical protein